MKRPMIAVIALALAGCGGSNDDGTTVSTGDSTVHVSGDDGTMKIEADDGSATIRSGKGSEAGVSLPDGLSLYPGSEVIMTMNGGDGGGSGGLTVMESGDSVETVEAFYRKQIEDLGLVIHTDGMFSGAQTIGARDDDSGSAVNVVITASGDKTQIHLTHARDG